MADIISTITPLITLFWQQITSLVEYVVATPYLMIGVGFLIAGGVIGLLQRLIRSV